MENYILRIYRRGNGEKEKVTGLLEEVEAGSRCAFHSFEELRGLLLSRSSNLEEKKHDAGE